MDPITEDPLLALLANVIQNGSPLVNTILLIAGAILWYRSGTPGLRRMVGAAASYSEGEGEESAAPPAMPAPYYPPQDNSVLEKKIDRLAVEIRKTKEDLSAKLVEYREEVRMAVHDHEKEDTQQFKEIAEQIGTLTGMMTAMSGGHKHA